jgi:nitronate monooxygenase
MSGALLERLGIELPVVQAGMGGGVAGHELAAEVSEAGGLGTLAIPDAERLRAELRAARERTSKPMAVNLLLPFARRAHREAAAEADVVVTFWGEPRRPSGRPWIHQCGSVEEARAARRAGADAVIVQGVEAGGHVRGELPALELLDRVRAALPSGYPVLLAGGLATAADVAQALAAGADAAVLGTRFLLTEESAAHPGYKRRVLQASETLVTELFGVGWHSAPHRVVPNAATERWARRDGRAPRLAGAIGRLMTPAELDHPVHQAPEVLAPALLSRASTRRGRGAAARRHAAICGRERTSDSRPAPCRRARTRARRAVIRSAPSGA